MKAQIRSIICLITVILISSTVILGQNYKSDVSKADFALKKGDYEAAAKFYAEAMKTVPKPGKANLDILYKQGFSEMQIKNYSKASVTFAQYINIAKGSSADLLKLRDVIQWKDWCDNELSGQSMLKITGTTDTYLTNMRGLNTSLNDLSITLDSRNEIIFFTSNKVYFDEKKLIDLKTNLFKSEFQNDILSEPLKLGAEINSLGEIISACLAYDNMTIYFTVASEDHEKADIYTCKYRSGKFEKPIKLPKIINSKYFDGYPSVSDDGKALYFVSDRPGGIGGKDLYVSRVLPDGGWSEPYNLGKTVNTKYDEITPYIEKGNETLYFSSKGHPGNGGYDIFYSKMTNKSKWGAPVNMVEPFNSKSDDIAFVCTSDPNITYFSSSRKGGAGNFDIYKAGKAVNGTPIDEKPVLAENNGVKADTVKPNGFDEYKKMVETEKKTQPEAAVVAVPVVTPAKEITDTATVKKTEEATKTVVAVQDKSDTLKTQPGVTEVATTKPLTEKPKDVITEKPVEIAAIPKPNINIPLNKDTTILNSSMSGLVFRVQLGAFRNHITVNSSYFNKLNKKLIQEELSEDMLYKYTIGSFESISRASLAKKVIREAGYSDAFLACYYNTKRISMQEALQMLDKKVYQKLAFYQD
jgi:hypothetical protein